MQFQKWRNSMNLHEHKEEKAIQAFEFISHLFASIGE